MTATIETFVGSIVDPRVGAHAIVNASNPELGLGSGVSGAIREACGGHSFQELVRTAWREEFDEPLEPGDCLVTTAGSCLHLSWVLHVPTVNYRARDAETSGFTGPRRIRSCMTAAIREATELAETEGLVGELVLATPLLGAGHGGLGSVRSLEAMMDAVRRWRDNRGWRLGKLVVAVLESREARLVGLAAQRFGLE